MDVLAVCTHRLRVESCFDASYPPDGGTAAAVL
jgi:hypothetical protein